MSKIIPVILCGGKGTRLWPLSRQSYPKQFLNLFGEDDKSLLQQTLERLSDLKQIEEPIIICNEEHRFIVAEQMREINISPTSIILETEGRNTAPAIALGAIKSLEQNNDSIILVLSADHIIKDNKNFHAALKKGFQYAKEDNLVTFGIIPYQPETGYGYIESEPLFLGENELKASKIKKFIEKPNINLAKRFIQSNCYTWNSGMFIFKSKVILKELDKYSPDILNHCQKAMKNSIRDLDFTRIDNLAFSQCQSLPIDIAVMEKTKKGMVIPLNVGWSDIGSWKSLWENEEKDNYGNVMQGNVICEDSSNCYLKSDSRLLVTLGLKDLIVVETPDVVLVANNEKLGNLKSLVTSLESRGYKEGLMHKKIFRPWGSYTSLIEDKEWLVKKIEVNPGSKLSLQMHHHRAEHWIVVNGTAEIQINHENFVLTENQSTFIPLRAKHRLMNPGEVPLTIIEIQSGKYISEDDIVRFTDDYGRG